MAKRILIGVLLAALAVISWAEVIITGEITTISTLGNAAESQKLISKTGNGIYDETKNGSYTAANLTVVFKPESYLEGYFKITGTNRPGSLYVPLELEYVSEKEGFDFAFDTGYGKVAVFEALGLKLPVSLFLKGGKYKTEASSFQKVSKYQTESVLAIMKTANTYHYDIEAVYQNKESDNPFKISGTFTNSFKLQEAAPRLWDTDPDHGTPVEGKYDSQLFASLKLQDFQVLNGGLSAEVVYALNGGEIYSGNSFGFSAGYTVIAAPDIKIPLGLGFAFYEKNIDALSRSSYPNTLDTRNTADFRNTWQIGFGGGLRCTLTSVLDVEANLGFAYTAIEHIYRDTLQIPSLSLDVQVIYNSRYFLGAGFIAGSLGDPQWKTSNDAAFDYDHTFSFSENFGFEVYGGIRLFKSSRFVIGFNTNKGLAMNHTLETRADGQIKYKQKDTEISDRLYEIGGLYFKLTLSF